VSLSSRNWDRKTRLSPETGPIGVVGTFYLHDDSVVESSGRTCSDHDHDRNVGCSSDR
jgi:hypothetical protein